LSFPINEEAVSILRRSPDLWSGTFALPHGPFDPDVVGTRMAAPKSSKASAKSGKNLPVEAFWRPQRQALIIAMTCLLDSEKLEKLAWLTGQNPVQTTLSHAKYVQM
jgi:hypothetical protein